MTLWVLENLMYNGGGKGGMFQIFFSDTEELMEELEAIFTVRWQSNQVIVFERENIRAQVHFQTQERQPMMFFGFSRTLPLQEIPMFLTNLIPFSRTFPDFLSTAKNILNRSSRQSYQNEYKGSIEEGRVLMVTNVLESRFGPLPESVSSRVRQMSLEALTDLMLRTGTASSLAELGLAEPQGNARG